MNSGPVRAEPRVCVLAHIALAASTDSRRAVNATARYAVFGAPATGMLGPFIEALIDAVEQK